MQEGSQRLQLHVALALRPRTTQMFLVTFLGLSRDSGSSHADLPKDFVGNISYPVSTVYMDRCNMVILRFGGAMTC